MDIICMLTERTSMSEASAAFYSHMAEERIKAYLDDDEVDVITKYPFQVCDIAMLYYQKDQSLQNASKSFGYARESFQEGSVRVEKAGMTGASIQSAYDRAIEDILANLDGDANVVKFL